MSYYSRQRAFASFSCLMRVAHLLRHQQVIRCSWGLAQRSTRLFLFISIHLFSTSLISVWCKCLHTTMPLPRSWNQTSWLERQRSCAVYTWLFRCHATLAWGNVWHELQVRKDIFKHLIDCIQWKVAGIPIFMRPLKHELNKLIYRKCSRCQLRQG